MVFELKLHQSNLKCNCKLTFDSRLLGLQEAQHFFARGQDSSGMLTYDESILAALVLKGLHTNLKL